MTYREGMQIKQSADHDVDGFPFASAYDITVGEKRFLLRKEFYASGESLFQWVLYLIVQEEGARWPTQVDVGSFSTKKKAIAYLESKYPASV